MSLLISGDLRLAKQSVSSITAYIQSTGIVSSGLVLLLDAATPLSYPGTGTTWTDLSGNGNTGTLTNGPTYSSANSGSIVFDGVNDYVSFPGSEASVLDFGTTNFSFSCWIKPGANAGGSLNIAGILNKRGNSGNGYRFDIFSGSIRILLVSSGTGGGVVVTANQGYVVNNWYHLVGVAENNTVKLYVNSVLQTQTGIYSGTVSNNTSPLEIGRMALRSDLSTNSTIPQASIYNRALSASEVSQNFNALKGRFGL